MVIKITGSLYNLKYSVGRSKKTYPLPYMSSRTLGVIGSIIGINDINVKLSTEKFRGAKLLELNNPNYFGEFYSVREFGIDDYILLCEDGLKKVFKRVPKEIWIKVLA